MKDIREVLKALSEDKQLRYIPTGSIVDLDNVGSYNFYKPEYWEIYDKFEDLKRAHEEGAKIEYYNTYSSRWRKELDPVWYVDTEYRIEGGIPIESWDKWKDLIKEWWNGTTIQYNYNGKWEDVCNTPTWGLENVYRIKPPKWEMQPASLLITNSGYIVDVCTGHITEVQKFGMKFHTEEAAEEAQNQMRRANRLRYWVSTLQHLGEGDYFIAFSQSSSQYKVFCSHDSKSPAEVYMTSETAREICVGLNEGILEL
jgi:hypothetical protein